MLDKSEISTLSLNTLSKSAENQARKFVGFHRQMREWVCCHPSTASWVSRLLRLTTHLRFCWLIAETFVHVSPFQIIIDVKMRACCRCILDIGPWACSFYCRSASHTHIPYMKCCCCNPSRPQNLHDLMTDDVG